MSKHDNHEDNPPSHIVTLKRDGAPKSSFLSGLIGAAVGGWAVAVAIILIGHWLAAF